MRRSLLLLLSIAGLQLSGCGAPQAGEECDQTGFLCQDATNALECRVGKWTALPCRGPGGCQRTGDNIKCDMTGNQAGDACASTAESKGMCASTGKATLECRQGQLVQTNTCTSCSVSGEQVVCQQ